MQGNDLDTQVSVMVHFGYFFCDTMRSHPYNYPTCNVSVNPASMIKPVPVT